ncbi:hypothetical protein FQN53_001908 [Emmonsiellopsis sp. PD_33]|nr:hypothetical protein FQN53_001908 [Emmonsiellopsis sp. PD_33]
MPRPTISLGFNTNKKSQPLSLSKPGIKPPQKRKKTIFDSDSEDDNAPKTAIDNGAIEITTIGGLSEPPPPPPSNNDNENKDTDDLLPPSKRLAPTKRKTPPSNLNTYSNLSSLHTSKKHAETAATLDSSIYDYDAVYDSIHAKKNASTTNPDNANDPSAPQVPKYMTSLLRSAELRKRDQLRARDKLLAREREAEGDEFADKEKFVTAAYKAQQEEARRIEAEEAEREKEEEERRRKGGGMMGFYKEMLQRGERRHEEVVKAAEEVVERRKEGDEVEQGEKEVEEKKEEEEEKEKSAAQIAAELNERGANIIINDEGQVVDKRQLLTAGLNVAAKPKAKPVSAANRDRTPGWESGARRGGVEAGSGRAGQRARQTEMLAAQLEERLRKEQEEKDAQAKELAEKNRSTKSAGDVQSARERYLARKREREMAAEKEKGKGKGE